MKSIIRAGIYVALASALAACNQPSKPSGDDGQVSIQFPTAPVISTPPVDKLSKNVVADKLPSATDVGEIRDDSIVSTGKDGYLIFGPYAAVDAGTYTVAIMGSVSALPVGSVKLDVTSNVGETSHGEVIVSELGALPWFEATLSTPVKDLEVRVFVPEGARVSVSSYHFTRSP